MLLKDGVNIKGVQPQVWYAIGFCDHLHQQMFGDSIVVTSLTDGQHNPGSKHPMGLAWDMRTKDRSASESARFFQLVKEALDKQGYDIVAEGGTNPSTPFTSGAHIHGEWDWHVGDADFFTRVT